MPHSNGNAEINALCSSNRKWWRLLAQCINISSCVQNDMVFFGQTKKNIKSYNSCSIWSGHLFETSSYIWMGGEFSFFLLLKILFPPILFHSVFPLLFWFGCQIFQDSTKYYEIRKIKLFESYLVNRSQRKQ